MMGTDGDQRPQLGDPPSDLAFDYVWRVRTRLPDRRGQRCAVIARGAMNSCIVVFEDGVQVVTSRNYVRRAEPDDERYGDGRSNAIVRHLARRHFEALCRTTGSGPHRRGPR